jgi:hypothetical protein
MLEAANLNQTSGINLGGALRDILNTYQGVSQSRYERDTARYTAAAATQLAALNPPQAPNMTDAMNTGIAQNPAVNPSTGTAMVPGQITMQQAATWGGIALAVVVGGALILKAVR